MSIFSKIKGAKKAAEKHKAAKASETPVEKKDAPVPYKHVPTHAAVDALTGAPSSWREDDRAAIKHQHKRRSMMTRNSSAISTLHPSSSYTGSDFSSYGMMPATNNTRPSPHRIDTRRSYNGANQYQPSPLASNGVSPTGSQHSTSSSSSQLIELPSTNMRQSTQYGQHLTPVEHMHKSTTRRLGEAPILDSPPPRPMAVKPSTTTVSAPVNPKKRSWGFMKRNSQTPAIAAH